MRAGETLVALAVLMGSCSSEAPLDVPSGCQPLEGDLSCTLPYPSDFFLTGGEVVLSGAAKPVSTSGADADLVTPVHADGFSRQPSLAFALPDAVVADGLPNIEDDGTRSMDPIASPTVLVNAQTGAPVPHYVDLDPAPDDATHVVIAIRPLVQLSASTRYVVAIKGVKNAGGSLAAPAEGFRRIRDTDLSQDPSLAPIAARYETDVFPVTDQLGIERSSLQLAWDFTTESVSWPEHDMMYLRSLAQVWLDQNPSPNVTVTQVSENVGAYFREILGTITVPLFLQNPNPGALLERDASGEITQNGTAEVPFKIVVPQTVTEQWGQARGLAFGHGFFGTEFGASAEMDEPYTQTLLSTLGTVTFGINWWGMSADDFGSVVALFSTTPAQLWQFVDRVHQAMVNWMVMTRAMRTSFALQPALHRPLAGAGVIVRPDGSTNAGSLLYDPSHVDYFGASLGSILGTVMSALDPDVERAVLNVGGASYEQMLPRSQPFAPFGFFLKSNLGTELATQTVEAMLANMMDRIDPATYAPYLVGSKLLGNPDRQVILQAGIGDNEVPNCATYFLARTLGISMLAETPQSTYGVPLASADTLSSALTTWDFGISPDVYQAATPPDPNPVHIGLRTVPSAMAQMNAFLQPGGPVLYPCVGQPWCTGP